MVSEVTHEAVELMFKLANLASEDLLLTATVCSLHGISFVVCVFLNLGPWDTGTLTDIKIKLAVLFKID